MCRARTVRITFCSWCAFTAAISLTTAITAAPLTAYNTGVDNSSSAWASPNVPDIHYSLIVQPGSATAVTVDDSTYPFGPWLANNSGSRWIGPAINGFAPGGSNYAYRTTFNVPSNALLSSVNLAGVWASDDAGTDILINGLSTGQTSSPNPALLTPFTINSGFVVGTNTLDFYLTNAGVAPFTNATGLRVDHIAGSYVVVPEPASLCLTASAVFIGVLVARRGRRAAPSRC